MRRATDPIKFEDALDAFLDLLDGKVQAGEITPVPFVPPEDDDDVLRVSCTQLSR